MLRWLKKVTFKNITPKSLNKRQDIIPSLSDILAKEIVQKGTFPKNHTCFLKKQPYFSQKLQTC